MSEPTDTHTWRRDVDAAPDELKDLTAGCPAQLVTIGCSSARTVCFRNRSGRVMYLKMVDRGSVHTLQRELDVTSWLTGKLPVPEVMYWGKTEEHAYLLLSEVVGIVACDERLQEYIPSVVRLLARGMQLVHGVDISVCTFDQRLDRKLEQAQYRVSHGLVDQTNFEPEWLHRSAEEILAELIATRPIAEDLVFTHGDYCLPNVMIDGTDLGGFIDLGSAGVADRYQDLSLACRSLSHNWGPKWVPQLLDEYGISDVDEKRLEYYRLMDELF